jgi:hypothetical protein
MAHPRAVFPTSVITYYRAHGYRRTCEVYRTSWVTLRRWLREHGVEVRGQGVRLGRAS